MTASNGYFTIPSFILNLPEADLKISVDVTQSPTNKKGVA